MNKKEKNFIETVWKHYKTHGRHDLPWRKTKDPYKILVSEVMLQQTQVDRVLPKYKAFIQKWGSIEELGRATLGDVLKEWQGLGYNRRAKNLHKCALVIINDNKSTWPKSHEGLVQLPGIGSYTAGAIMAFAYNKPTAMVETNIRTVYLHHFFKDETDVSDKEILRYIEATLDTDNPREWYWALMDYGAFLKKEFGNPNSKSKHYTKQSKFEGSDRQIRGAIIRELSNSPLTRKKMHVALNRFEDIRIDVQLQKLIDEGMLQKVRSVYKLAD